MFKLVFICNLTWFWMDYIHGIPETLVTDYCCISLEDRVLNSSWIFFFCFRFEIWIVFLWMMTTYDSNLTCSWKKHVIVNINNIVSSVTVFYCSWWLYVRVALFTSLLTCIGGFTMSGLHWWCLLCLWIDVYEDIVLCVIILISY